MWLGPKHLPFRQYTQSPFVGAVLGEVPERPNGAPC